MLYTGKGDNGTTKLFGCAERVAKDDPAVSVLGNLDELNSWLGFCSALTGDPTIVPALRRMQEDLFVIQACIAGAPKMLARERVGFLEMLIADVEHEIEPIGSFTIPGATVVSGALDFARTIARRTERSILSLKDTGDIVPYLNRLSSALFALARLAAHRTGVKEQAPSY